MRLFSTVVEQMVLQNSISTNDFSHSVQGWSFSPVCISKCLPKVLELLNDFLHSVVQLCGFSSLSMIMCSFSFPVCVNDLLHCAQMWGFPQYEKAYGSVSAGRGKRLFRVLFFWKVEPSCCKTWHSRVYFSIVSSKLGLVDQKITSWPSVMIFYMIFI